MISANNPAGRLYVILKQFRDNAPTPSDVNSTRLAQFFQAQKSDGESETLEVIHRLIELLKLVDDTIQAITTLDLPDPEPYLRPFPQIRRVIYSLLVNLRGQWATYHKEVVKIDFGALEFCSTKLMEYPTEQPIKQADFDKILSDVQELFDDVNREGMPPNLRAFILDSLESIRRAIVEYRIRGAERLREELGSIVGAVYINYHIVESEQNKPQITKLWQIFNGLKSLVDFASKARPLAEPFIKGWLGTSDHTPPS
jgi:hypothetical protein